MRDPESVLRNWSEGLRRPQKLRNLRPSAKSGNFLSYTGGVHGLRKGIHALRDMPQSESLRKVSLSSEQTYYIPIRPTKVG